MTPRALLQQLARRFAPLGGPGAGPRELELEAQRLIAHAIGAGADPLDPGFDRPLPADELERVETLARRRLDGESLAYIVGRAPFRTLTLLVDPRVLIPRLATHTLVDVAIEAARVSGWETPRIADVCTGSGAVALALATELPASRVVAVDLSPDALAVARANVARLGSSGLGQRVELRQGDLLGPLAGGRFEIIVSNPPYIPTRDLATQVPEVQREPRLALDGGDDGLDVIRRLVDGARELLVPGGLLAIEHGTGQSWSVCMLLHERGFTGIQAARDAGGMLRIVSGRA